MDPMSRKLYRTNAEVERQEKLSEAAQLMSRLALIIEKTRSLDQILYRLRRKRCMKIVWTRRGRNEDTLLNDMLHFLRKKASRLDSKTGTSQETDEPVITP